MSIPYLDKAHKEKLSLIANTLNKIFPEDVHPDRYTWHFIIYALDRVSDMAHSNFGKVEVIISNNKLEIKCETKLSFKCEYFPEKLKYSQNELDVRYKLYLKTLYRLFEHISKTIKEWKPI